MSAGAVAGAVRCRLRAVYLAARWIAGRWWFAVPALTLAWPAWLVLRLAVGWRPEAYQPYEAHWVIAFPLALLGTALGVRVIAADLDRRTIEILYTVPGGSHRAWLLHLGAAASMLAAAEALLATATAIFLTAFPPALLYGPLQAGLFFLAVSMGLSVLFRSEVTGALASIPVLGLFLAVSGAEPTVRLSPFFHTYAPQTLSRYHPQDLLAWTVQNRIGFALLVAALVALTFARANRRERMIA